MPSNEIYAHEQNHRLGKRNPKQFQSGLWSCHYYQYGRWHGPHVSELSFDRKMFTVRGTGADDIGAYTIAGFLCSKKNRISLKKTYQIGTGNPRLNLGHDVIIRLVWNAQERQFGGTWSVKTSRYTGEGRFVMKSKWASYFQDYRLESLLSSIRSMRWQVKAVNSIFTYSSWEKTTEKGKDFH